jgi:hypothetical protein
VPEIKCHPERSSRFAKRSSYAVEGPLHPPQLPANCQGKTRVERTLLSAASDSDLWMSSGRVPHPSFSEGWDSAPTARDLSPTPATPSTVERTDDPHHPPFSQSARKRWGHPAGIGGDDMPAQLLRNMRAPNIKCHPERSSRFAKRSSYAVEGPLPPRNPQQSVKARPVWSGHSCPLPLTLICGCRVAGCPTLRFLKGGILRPPPVIFRRLL